MATLFRRYARAVRGFGQKVLRDDSESDDLVQEVFLYIHRRSGLFDGSKGSARSWIFQVAYTQALIRRRQLKSHGFYSVRNHGQGRLKVATLTHRERATTQSVEGCFGRDGWKKHLG